MDVVIVTGAYGLVGGAVSEFLARLGITVVAIDNDMRSYFFGPEASTQRRGETLARSFPNFLERSVDVRNREALESVFLKYKGAISAVVHCAAQPSHDWAAREPLTDFAINALGTLNLLELCRAHSPQAPFVFMSTNKVYGDRPNRISLVETATRWTPSTSEPWRKGFSEELSIDDSTHSLFGVSKASADLLVQEYGRYFGLPTVCFRGGCLTGPTHASTELHGFLSYLVKCTVQGVPYRVFGHKGKQVRDNIHTDDLVQAFWQFILNPSPGAVFNIGGGEKANVSLLEAIEIAQEFSGRELQWTLESEARIGDHVWYVSDLSKFKTAYPTWDVTIGIREIIREMVEVELT